MLLGPLAYMSPEQARGEELDSRSDMFSLGVVLYEMATGTLPFTGRSLAVVFDNILNAPAPLATQANPRLPVGMDHILAKSLEKDAALRYQSAAEFRADLKRLRRDVDSGRVPTDTSSSPVVRSSARRSDASSDSQVIAGLLKRHRRTVLAWSAAALILVGALVYGLTHTGKEAPSPTASLEIARVTGSGAVQQADISPDSKYLAYVRQTAGKQSLWLKQLATDSEVQIASLDEDECTGLAFSPDGNYVDFVRQQRKTIAGDLYQVPALGGAPRKMLGAIPALRHFHRTASALPSCATRRTQGVWCLRRWTAPASACWRPSKPPSRFIPFMRRGLRTARRSRSAASPRNGF